MRRYVVKGLSVGNYKFTVKSYTSAGEDTGSTAFITLEPFSMWPDGLQLYINMRLSRYFCSFQK